MITVPEIRAICVEAFETMHRMPRATGPVEKLRIWPEMAYERDKDWHTGTNRARIQPTAEQISRMDWFFDAVNRLESEADRRAVFEWGRIKTSKGRTIRGFAEKWACANRNIGAKSTRFSKGLSFTSIPRRDWYRSVMLNLPRKSATNGQHRETHGTMAKSEERTGLPSQAAGN